MFNLELSQMVTLSTTEFFLIPSKRPTLMLKPPDLVPLLSNKLLMHGETEPLPTPVQLLSHMVFTKHKLTQTDILSTTVSFPIPSRRPTLMPRPPELLPLPSNKLLINGETEPPQTQDQLLCMHKTQMTTTTTIPTLIKEKKDSLPGKTNTKRNPTGVKPNKKELMPGELFHISPRTLNGKVLLPLLKDNQVLPQLITDSHIKL